MGKADETVHISYLKFDQYIYIAVRLKIILRTDPKKANLRILISSPVKS